MSACVSWAHKRSPVDFVKDVSGDNRVVTRGAWFTMASDLKEWCTEHVPPKGGSYLIAPD